MIRVQHNEFTVGSLPPPVISRVGKMIMPSAAQKAIDTYVGNEAWVDGYNFLILGPPGCGKTSTGLYLMRSIVKAGHDDLNIVYWTEADFHDDLRNLWRYESLVQKSVGDGPLWNEYTEWERSLWDLKEARLLFMDDVGRGHTPNQRYELESLLRRRRDMGLGTIVAAEQGAWGALPSTLTSLFNESQKVQLQEVQRARG